MKTIKSGFFDSSTSEKRDAVYFMDENSFGKHYWARLVTVCETRTNRSWRVTVYGNHVKDRMTTPLNQRTWILKEHFQHPDFKYNHVAHTALFMARKTRLRYYGTLLVDRWRKSNVCKLVALGIKHKMDRKYGVGKWLHSNETAQIECDRWLHKAMKVKS